MNTQSSGDPYKTSPVITLFHFSNMTILYKKIYFIQYFVKKLTLFIFLNEDKTGTNAHSKGIMFYPLTISYISEKYFMSNIIFLIDCKLYTLIVNFQTKPGENTYENYGLPKRMIMWELNKIIVLLFWWRKFKYEVNTTCHLLVFDTPN